MEKKRIPQAFIQRSNKFIQFSYFLIKNLPHVQDCMATKLLLVFQNLSFALLALFGKIQSNFLSIFLKLKWREKFWVEGLRTPLLARPEYVRKFSLNVNSLL